MYVEDGVLIYVEDRGLMCMEDVGSLNVNGGRSLNVHGGRRPNVHGGRSLYVHGGPKLTSSSYRLRPRVSEERFEVAAGQKFEDDESRMFFEADSDEVDNVWVTELAHDQSLHQEIHFSLNRVLKSIN